MNKPYELGGCMKKNLLTVLILSGISVIASACGSPPAAPITGAITTAPGAFTMGASQCMPLGSTIGFQAQGFTFTSFQIKAGTIPSIDTMGMPGQYGTVVVSAAGTRGLYNAPNSRLTITPDGEISMNILPVAAGTPIPNTGYTGGYTGVPTGTTAYTATGTLTLSASKLQQIQYQLQSASGYNNGYNNGYNTGFTAPVPQMGTNCISGVAISMSHDNYDLYGGRVYLYFNNNSSLYTYMNF
jgi:hypothetical protein